MKKDKKKIKLNLITVATIRYLLRYAVINKEYFIGHDPDGLKSLWIETITKILEELDDACRDE